MSEDIVDVLIIGAGASGPAALTVEFMTNLYTAGGGTRELISRTLENIRRGVM